MTDLTQSKKFASTIGAEAFARDKYDGPFPLAVTVTTMHRTKGLVNKVYTMHRKPTLSDMQPVGTLSR